MAKTLKQIEAGLAERYSGDTYEKDGRTYIPWEESVYAANRIFGIDGYDVSVVSVKREGEGYMAVVRVTVYASDGRAITREGVGYNELSVTRDQKELIDTAIKGAASDALNRALRLFGDAFGLFISIEAKAAKANGRSSGNASRPAAAKSNGSSSGKWSDKPATEALSEKQLWVLVNKLGVSDEDLENMTAGEAKALLDKGMGGGNGKSAAAPAKSSRRVTTPDDDEDGDEPF